MREHLKEKSLIPRKNHSNIRRVKFRHASKRKTQIKVYIKSNKSEENHMTFQEKVIRLRKMKGLTQDEFASAVGVSRQAVYKWESGKSYPEAAKLVEIKILFNISIDDLLDDSYEVALPEKKKRKRLTKEEKAIVEAEVLGVPAVKEAVPAATAEKVSEPAPKEEEVPVPAAVAAESSVAEEPVTEEIITPVVDEPKEEPAPEAKPEKKVGFFGRLFGRK